MSDPIIRVFLVDDHAIVREGLRALLADADGIVVAGEAANGESALHAIAQLRPDVVLMDVMMPGMNGIELLRRVRRSPSPPHVIMLTSFAEATQVNEALAAGALGYLLKDALKEDLLAAIRAAAAGRPALHPEAQRRLIEHLTAGPSPLPFEQLTPRECDVLRQLTEGSSNKAIATSLGLTEGTVKGHVTSILLKLNVEDRTQAAVFAIRNGFLDRG